MWRQSESFSWTRGKPKSNLLFVSLHLAACLSTELRFFNSFIVFPLTALMSVIFETCGFLFCQNILWVWLVCRNQTVHAIFLYKPAKTTCASRTTKDVSFILKLITIRKMIQFVWHCCMFQLLCSCLCAFTHNFTCTESQRLSDGHGSLKQHIEHKLPAAVRWESFSSEHVWYNLWSCGLCQWHFRGNVALSDTQF